MRDGEFRERFRTSGTPFIEFLGNVSAQPDTERPACSTHLAGRHCMTRLSPGHWRTYLLLGLMVILGPLGNVFLGKGMKHICATTIWSASGLLHFVSLLSKSAPIWLGVACLLAFFAVYMLLLSWADYSYVQPASAIAYAMVALLGHFVLGEVVTPLRWAGVLVIAAGVLVVGHTPPRTTEYNG
jgi:drug/metabolite transporter (DMT)-like permease